MASGLLSLADASALLGVSPERVRQLVVAGDLPGVRFGNAWAVPRESIDARRNASNRRGRPLSERRAWQSIAAGDVDLSNVSRYRNRGEVHRYEMSDADREFVHGQERAMVSGAVAANGFGELLQADGAEADLYVSASLHRELGVIVAAVPDQLGGVTLRVVSDELWPHVEHLDAKRDRKGRHLAPRAAVALDLMESGNPRHWVAAERLVDGT
jgi:excisionase family DNA binding protein